MDATTCVVLKAIICYNGNMARPKPFSEKEYPPSEVGIVFSAGPELNSRLVEFLDAVPGASSLQNRTSGSYLEAVDNKLPVNMAPGHSYESAMIGKLDKYKNYLEQSVDRKFGLLSEATLARIPNQSRNTQNPFNTDNFQLLVKLNLLNYQDRDKIVHPPFFLSGTKPSVRLAMPFAVYTNRGRRFDTSVLQTSLDDLRNDLNSGPVIKDIKTDTDIKTAPEEFFVTSPQLTIKHPPMVE